MDKKEREKGKEGSGVREKGEEEKRESLGKKGQKGARCGCVSV